MDTQFFNPYRTTTRQSQSNYQDRDGDGRPDHVLGPDGLWHQFDPYTGETIGSPFSAGAEGVFPQTPMTPASFGISTGQPVNAPKTPKAAAAPSYGGLPPRTYGGNTAPPTYRDGSSHPFFGGAPRTPGGPSAGQSSGGPQSVYNPDTGASAGANFTRAPRLPESGLARGAFEKKGGGSNMGANSGIGQKMAAKVRGMASAITDGVPKGASTYNSYSSSSYKPYEPETPKMRGWARKIDPEQALGLYSRPSMLLPKVAPNFGPENPRYGMFSDLPMTELTQLLGGRKLSAPKTDDYGNLTKKDRSLSDFTNALRDTYDSAITNETWFDYDTMARNLMNARGKSAVGSAFRKMPVGTQVGNLLNYTGAIFGTNFDPVTARVKQDRVSALADELAAKYLNKKSKKTPAFNRKLGQDIFYV